MEIFGARRGLYFVADLGLLPRARVVDVTRAALEGGAVMVQLRAKSLTATQMQPPARELVALCKQFEVPLIVNDLPEVAVAVGAAGAHVGQEDATVAHARALLGEQAIVGATTPTEQAVRRAEAEGASYVSVGPIFPSPTKPWKPAAGPELARRLRAVTDLPLCVIGGITADNVHELAGCGVDLVCVISAIAKADDPRAATEQLIAAMRAAEVVCGNHPA
ncbi:MAG: thiamine phosphate synthase [Armatimonadota bacterium]